MNYINIETLHIYNEKLKEMTSYQENKIKITNCKNCGAPLKKSKCEYCGTEY
jgi:predicted RNA-binding protein with PUA domain